MELFLSLFDLIGNNLDMEVEESRQEDMILGTFNNSFITNIPKKDPPSSFNNYRPISLYNYIHKIISKIITRRINPILSKGISLQQFGFLEDKSMMDAMSLTQETLHTIKKYDVFLCS
jgi:hypothetical protein